MSATSHAPSAALNDVLVIGGCGFLGHHIVALLLDKHPNARISVLDLQTNHNRQDGVQYYDADITDSEQVRTVFAKAKPQVVIHTASPKFDANQRDLVYKVNVTGTETLLAVAKDTGVKAFVYTSSPSVVSDAKHDLINADERYPYIIGKQQHEYYSETKALAERAVLAANRSPPSFLTAAIRPSSMFGEGDVQMIPALLLVLRNRQTRFQLGANDNLFDVTYVANAAHAHILAALALLKTHATPLPERVDGEAFVVTNDTPIYFWDFARAVWRAAGDETEPRDVWVLNREVAMVVGAVLEWGMWVLGRKAGLTVQQAKYACMTRYYSIAKAKRRLGYQPVVTLEEGVARTVRWFGEREGEGEGSGKKDR